MARRIRCSCGRLLGAYYRPRRHLGTQCTTLRVAASIGRVQLRPSILLAAGIQPGDRVRVQVVDRGLLAIIRLP